MSTSRTPSPSALAAFRNRNFTLLWTGQFVETIGNSLTSLAASIYVYRLTGSTLSVGLMLMATAAPSLLMGLFAGVFVDRYASGVYFYRLQAGDYSETKKLILLR